ncbi:MAG: F-type H+-transporting ATPase subunit epsilon [Fimbriimonadaceae bacterium]|jgi:F-type H+-transporting ATPase subunit epsilon|nr:F-type H+-transporting ATPase subunit epsilon [Fimbriimonadaceae bacterium]
MAKDFTLSVVAPDRSVVEERATTVVAPGIEGYFGVLAGHEPMISAIKTGILEYQVANGDRHFVAVGGGFAEVTPERVTILADTAELAPEIDIAEAERIQDEARKALRGEPSSLTREQATEELERAINRIKAARLRS